MRKEMESFEIKMKSIDKYFVYESSVWEIDPDVYYKDEIELLILSSGDIIRMYIELCILE